MVNAILNFILSLFAIGSITAVVLFNPQQVKTNPSQASQQVASKEMVGGNSTLTKLDQFTRVGSNVYLRDSSSIFGTSTMPATFSSVTTTNFYTSGILSAPSGIVGASSSFSSLQVSGNLSASSTVTVANWVKVGSTISNAPPSTGAPLTIANTGATIALQGTSVSDYSGANMFDSNGVLAASFQYGNASASVFPNTMFLGTRIANAPLVFVTAGVNERLRIDASGNLILAKQTGYNSGTFYLDTSGNVSTSGTLQILGSTTSTLSTGGLNIGSGQFVVQSGNGYVGVGTATPSAPIHLVSSLLNSDLIKIKNSSASGYASIGFLDSNNNQAGGFGFGNVVGGLLNDRVYFYGTTKDLLFSTDQGASSAMLIQKTSNKVGFGTNSPTDKLTVVGNVRVGDGTVSSTLGKDFLSIATSTPNMSGLFYVDSSGNVTASGTLGIKGLSTLTGGLISNASSSIGAGLQVAGALNASGTLLTNNILPALNSNKNIGAFGSAYSNIFVSSSLKLGGDNVNSNVLDIQNNIAGDVMLNVKNSSASGYAAVRFQVQNDVSNGSLSMYNSNYPVAVFPNRFALITGTAAAGIDMIAQNTTGDLRLMTGGINTRLYISSGGNVSIGSWASGINPSPTDKLTISGGNLRIGDGTVSSTLGSNFLSIATSTANPSGLFFVDSSGNIFASGTLKLTGALTSDLLLGNSTSGAVHVSSSQATAPTVIVNSPSGGTCTNPAVNGTDSRGMVSWTGDMAMPCNFTLTFSKPYPQAPFPSIKPTSSTAASYFTNKVYATTTVDKMTITQVSGFQTGYNAYYYDVGL